MKVKPFGRSNALLIASFIFLCSSGTFAQRTPAPEPTFPPIRWISYGGDMRAFLGHLAQSYDATIGFETDLLQPQSDISLDVKTPTIDMVIDAVVKSKPIYGWRRDGRAIDVYPNQNSSPFLETVIPSFEVSEVPKHQAVGRLFVQTEVREALERLGMSWADYPRLEGNTESRITIKSQGLTVRQLLHQIASQSGARFWVFGRSGPRGEKCTFELTGK